MDRLRAPTEFGFTTPPYIPPERPRPLWRTLLVATLLVFIPVIGPGVSVVYVDRRRHPSTFDFVEAVKTAVIQGIPLSVLLLVAGVLFYYFFGITTWAAPGGG